MLYKFLKVLVGFSLKIFFQKIYVSGTEHVKKHKAQIIASNHPSGFLEPLIMACYLPKPLYFLVRGDVFKNPIANYLLRATHQIPIFRFRDGFSKMRNNSKTMDESLEVLNAKNNLLIFAEGGTQCIKKLRPLQKGIARIAFQTLEAHPDLDLEILPTGINFTHFTEFNREIYLKIGPPIAVKPFFDLYCEDKNKGITSLLDAVYEGMKENIVHLENQNLLNIFENTVPCVRAQLPLPYLPVLVHKEDKLVEEKKWANTLDNLGEDTITHLKSSLSEWRKKYGNYGLHPKDAVKKPINSASFLILVLGFLPALIGVLIHILPISVGLYFKRKIVKQKEFKNSLQFAFGVFISLIQYIVLFIIALVTFNFLFWLILPLITGLWARYYYFVYENTKWVKTKVFNNFQSDINQKVKTVKQ